MKLTLRPSLSQRLSVTNVCQLQYERRRAAVLRAAEGGWHARLRLFPHKECNIYFECGTYMPTLRWARVQSKTRNTAPSTRSGVPCEQPRSC